MSDILSASELSNIEAEVQKELDKELKAKEKERVRAELLQKAREARGLAESSEPVLIDLPPYADKIMINNFSYMQGRSYNVKASVAILLRESMQRSWQHQAEVEGRSKDFFQRTWNTRMSMATGAVQNAPFLKA